ncbi:DUF4332 domain-containing protein [Spirulina sp. CCNP1310]|uniref:DUF4332 domain-containing protein n=1 Tax=Spirulina sp. CCNP1310 TaxID=3110249 RepID=UPI002B208989|nr:DUF4332 domain-containing protein [Spirulina sp. CCNP1310]MEA5419603.1 DUF4332 domain-containing protein [Spirulina sp. CCNP1310]
MDAPSTLRSLSWPVAQLPGLPAAQAAAMAAVGIHTTADLLTQGRTPAQQGTMAPRLQITVSELRKWLAMADLARIPTVGCAYCGLLLHGGIASVVQLSQTPAPRLHGQLLRLHVATMQRRDLCPTLPTVRQWITEAQVLTRRGLRH